VKLHLAQIIETGFGLQRPFGQDLRKKFNEFYGRAGLPDFPWYKIPKREKYTKLSRTIQNVQEI
jgi:hypothetical protein